MKYLIYVFLLFVSMAAWSQEVSFKISGRISNLDLGTNEGGVTVTMYQDGKVLGTTQTSSNGKYNLNVNGDKNATFRITYTKPGLVSKSIELSPAAVYVEDLPAGNVIPTPPLDLDMFAERPNVDFSFLDTEPVAKFYWDERNRQLNFDRGASDKMKKKIEDLLLQADKDAAELEMKYNQAIQKADAFYAENKYEEALEKYEEALSYKPKEKYPSDKILELDALIQKQKEEQLAQEQQDAEYNNLIKAGDNLRDQGKLEDAVAKYKEALSKKDNQYPKDQIADLNAKIEAQKLEAENQAKYDEAIKRGDIFFKQNSIDAAKTKYEEAVKLKPSEEYPKKKLKEIEDKQKEQEALAEKQSKYNDAVAAGDKAFDAEDFATAKTKYDEALTLEPSSSYVKERVKICEAKLAELEASKAQKQKIEELMKAGMSDMTNKDYANAKSKFEEVLTLDSEHVEAKTQLELAKQKLEEEAAKAEQQKEFEKLVQEGDQAVKSSDYEGAIGKYEAAIAIQSTPEVNQKLKDAQASLADKAAAAEKKANYDKAMGEADALMVAGDLKGAKGKYQEASTIDPSQQLPKDKITQIDKLLGDQEAEAEKQAKLDAAISEGDHQFDLANWSEAEKRYREALTIDPGNAHAKMRVSEIEAKMKDEAAAAEVQKKYDDAIKAANDLYGKSNWAEAKSKYQEALTAKPGDEFATGRITELESKMSSEEAAKELADQINKLLTDGKSLHDQKKLDEAKGKYEEVLSLEAGNAVATKALEAINAELAAQKSQEQRDAEFDRLKGEGYELAGEKKYQEAKNKLNEALSLKDDSEVKSKIKEIDGLMAAEESAKEIDEKYNTAIAAAESLENANDLRNAIAKYKEAGLIKPSESLPKTKVSELEQRLKENEDLAKVDEKYNAAMAEGESLFSKKDYIGAKAAYLKAANIKPEESLPKQKIDEIDNLIRENEDQARIDKEYADWMKKGDELFDAKNYLGAIEAYNNALAVKPTEKEPVEKAEKARIEEEKKGDGEREYEKILTVAEKKIDERDFAKAKELAERAKGFRPDDPRPQNLLDRIAQMETIDREYAELMKKGDELATSKKYADARSAYESASRKKPEEQMPKDKMAEMDRLIDSASSEAQKEELYKEYMANGSDFQTNESYQQALSSFQDALSVKPGDAAAKKKIEEVQKILDEIANQAAKDLDKKNAFDKLIKEADTEFGRGEYMTAKSIYEKALVIDPGSEYAKLQIDECVRKENINTEEQLKNEYLKIIAAADKNFNAETYDEAKKYYSRALTLKKDDPYPKQKLAEIESILHPVTLASVELEDLGDPADNSIMDGGYFLDKSRKELELAKGIAVQDEFGNIQDSESKMTSDKTKEHYENSNDIYAIQMEIQRDEGERDLHQQAVNQALREAETELQNADSKNQEFEHNTNVVDQNTLYQVNNEVALEYGEDIAVYAENADVMKAYNTAQAERVSKQIRDDHQANVATDKDITAVKNEVDAGMREDYEKRDEVSQTIKVVEKSAAELQSERAESKYADQLGNKDQLRQIELNIEEKFVEDAEMSTENDERLKRVRGDVYVEEMSRSDQNAMHLQETEKDMDNVKLMIEEDSKDRDQNRLNSVEVLKEGNKELADADHLAYNTAMEKNNGNKELIEEQVKQNGEVVEKEKEAHDRKVEYVNQVDEQVRIEYSAEERSESEEHIQAKKAVENVYTDVQTTNQEEAQKTKENATVINDVTKTIDKNNANQAIGQKEKSYNIEDQIGDVDNTLKPKPKLANELGQEYPEGVSQENFTRKDNRGVVTTFITRRIVVIDGHADVYVRTQTLNGITYTKNDKPIVEHVWNSETQGPHLERHF